MIHGTLNFEELRKQIVGVDSTFATPYGDRLMVYADYTASGRCLNFVEHYLMRLQRNYANTHTEDDVTGRNMTRLLHEAEAAIKRSVNAGESGRIVACGSGSTAAIDKLQQMLGIAISPATKERIFALLEKEQGLSERARMEAALEADRPVVFVGPYEHHSNEVTWRQGLATVVEVNLAADGSVDLEHLEQLLKDPLYQRSLRLGSFSAASNVTGRKSDVHALAVLLHRYGALACFDYAASAPYVPIDMNPPARAGEDPSLDAIFVSPHKFIGGPGSSGVLVFHERIYRQDLPPTVAGGGTVSYVSPSGHDFVNDVEEREKAGTPGVLQTLKAALVFELKDRLGADQIEAREHQMLAKALKRWGAMDRVDLLGDPDPDTQIGICSFNLKTSDGSYLHPRLVTVLLNDLFGIQSRAGCSCAGPYGHTLLGISQAESERFRQCILKGWQGVKPGWCRVGFHFSMDEAEADFLIEAVAFLAMHGEDFLVDYCFDAHAANWSHKRPVDIYDAFSLDDAILSNCAASSALAEDLRKRIYRDTLQEAADLAAALRKAGGSERRKLEGEAGELQFFALS
jgi:selenocysteine lyase/cysteine desulfurase